MPSPAFITDEEIQPMSASCLGAPDSGWRITMQSAPSASRVCAVSLRDSPFVTDELSALTLMTSALRRVAAISKLTLVRVEFSKNRFTTVLPRRVGIFLISRVLT